MTEICKCGHRKDSHKNDICYGMRDSDGYPNCPCKKFKAQNHSPELNIKDTPEVLDNRNGPGSIPGASGNHSQQTKPEYDSAQRVNHLGDGKATRLMRDKTADTFNLSSNRSTFEDDDGEKTYWYREDFVREFIKIIENEATKPNLTMGERIEIIRKRAGDLR